MKWRPRIIVLRSVFIPPLLCLLTAVRPAAHAQDIDISGRVVDSAGAPIAGATVTLARQELGTTTDSHGAYSLVRLAARYEPSVAHTRAPRCVNGRLSFTIDGAAEAVAVQVFGIDGRLVHALPNDMLPAGRRTIDLPAVASGGIHVVRLRIGRRTWSIPSHSTRRGETSLSQRDGEARTARKQAAGSLDTLVVSCAGYATKRILVNSYIQYLVVYLSTRNQRPTFTINGGDMFTVYDTCVLTIATSAPGLTAVRLTDTTVAGIPLFDTPGNRNPVTSITPIDSASALQWILPPGSGAKCVWVEHTFTDSSRDTLSDCIDIAPYQIDVVLRNPRSGPLASMKPADSAYALENGGTALRYSLYRPYLQFSVDVHGDSSFAGQFDCAVAFADENGAKLTGYPLLRTVYEQLSFTGQGPAHDTSHVYEYNFDPDSVNGRKHLDSLYRHRTSLDRSHLYGLGSTGVYGILTSLSYNDSYKYGRKEIALILRFRGRYFDDDRSLIVSARTDPGIPYVVCLDVWPPRLTRSRWEYDMPGDGDTLYDPFRVSLSDGVESCLAEGSDDRHGNVEDMGGADVVSVDLVFARAPDELAASWLPYETFRQVTYVELMSLPHYSFALPIPSPAPKICRPVWERIDPTGWTDGHYLMAFVTEDSYGHRGIAPYWHFRGYGSEIPTSSNPQLVRIMTNHHEY